MYAVHVGKYKDYHAVLYPSALIYRRLDSYTAEPKWTLAKGSIQVPQCAVTLKIGAITLDLKVFNFYAAEIHFHVLGDFGPGQRKLIGTSQLFVCYSRALTNCGSSSVRKFDLEFIVFMKKKCIRETARLVADIGIFPEEVHHTSFVLTHPLLQVRETKVVCILQDCCI